jgi:hypothetical protein
MVACTPVARRAPDLEGKSPPSAVAWCNLLCCLWKNGKTALLACLLLVGRIATFVQQTNYSTHDLEKCAFAAIRKIFQLAANTVTT